jgi:hypothetical protein
MLYLSSLCQKLGDEYLMLLNVCASLLVLLTLLVGYDSLMLTIMVVWGALAFKKSATNGHFYISAEGCYIRPDHSAE